MQLNHLTPVRATATFIFNGGPHRLDGQVAWSDPGGKALFSNQLDDSNAGRSFIDVTLTAYADGESTQLHAETTGARIARSDSEVLVIFNTLPADPAGLSVPLTQADGVPLSGG